MVMTPKSPVPYLLSDSALPPVITISKPCISASRAVATSPQLMQRAGSAPPRRARNRAPGPAPAGAWAAAPARPADPPASAWPATPPAASPAP